MELHWGRSATNRAPASSLFYLYQFYLIEPNVWEFIEEVALGEICMNATGLEPQQ